MGGDYTRFTHDPKKHYNRVRMQQGRVQLDADWNESVDIIQDRLQKQAIDTFGRAAVSRFSTPDAFKVSVAEADLSLAPGRLYVDGLLAEILPGQPFKYSSQLPFYPEPRALSVLSGNALVYLDVWEREITYIEDPELLEKALGGPDTTTRIQTVWQVKVHELKSEAATCNPDFTKLFPPSAGRLSTREDAPPATTDPCILIPSGGYRGLENQLYRVEIHTSGGLGTAKFKWSRDNGSVVSAVQAVTTIGTRGQLTVSRIGRDEVLRFNAGDWVEITDDHRELMGEAGEMARIEEPLDEVAQTILLDRVIPTSGSRAFGANAEELRSRHTRIRRWDQKNATDRNGLLTIENTWTGLEDGVEVNFSLAGTGEFKVGNYWVFAARTADASVERLSQAPPRGIEHHYCALATLTGLPTPTVQEDCRTIWPPQGGQGGCCTVVVRPGESIQAAIDSLPREGGCVCLKTGTHTITEPIQITRSNITLQGETKGSSVVRDNGANLLAITGTTNQKTNIIIENVCFKTKEVTGESFQEQTVEDLFIKALIYLYQCKDVTIRHCECALSGKNLIGILVVDTEESQILDNLIEGQREPDSDNLDFGIRLLSTNEGMLLLTDEKIEIPSVLRTQVNLISGNRIRNPHTSISLSGTVKTQILNNKLSKGFYGINAQYDESLEVAYSNIEDMRSAGIYGWNLLENLALTHTRTNFCGYELLKDEDPEDRVDSNMVGGIVISNKPVDDNPNLPLRLNLRIESCEVLNTGLSPDGELICPGKSFGIYAKLSSCQISRNHIDNVAFYNSDSQSNDVNSSLNWRALYLASMYHEFTPPKSPYSKTEIPTTALVTDNIFLGIGLEHLIEIAGENDNKFFTNVTFNNNICDHFVEAEVNDKKSTLSIAGVNIIIIGNHIKPNKPNFQPITLYASFSIILGNVTRPGLPFAAPPNTQVGFNIEIP